MTIFKEFLHYTRLNSQSQMESGRINCKWKYNGSRRCRSAVSHLSQAGANWVRCGHICNLHIIMLEDRKIVSWWGEQEFDKETEATTIKCCRRMIYLIMQWLCGYLGSDTRDYWQMNVSCSWRCRMTKKEHLWKELGTRDNLSRRDGSVKKIAQKLNIKYFTAINKVDTTFEFLSRAAVLYRGSVHMTDIRAFKAVFGSSGLFQQHNHHNDIILDRSFWPTRGAFACMRLLV